MPDLDHYCEQCSSVLTFEPLAQTWHVKMWLKKAKSIERENNLIATSCRALRGVGYEPEARAG